MQKKRGRRKLPEHLRATPNDIIKCPICPGSFTRNNRFRHNQTKIHKTYELMEENLRNIITDQLVPKETKTMVDAIIKDSAIKNIKHKIKPEAQKKIDRLSLFDSSDEE